MVGDPSAERDQVVLGGRLSLLKFPLPALTDGARDQEEAQRDHRKNNTEGDQDIT